MTRNIKVQLIVHLAEDQPLSMAIEAVAKHLERKGFKATLPHVYPKDPLIIEYNETIKPLW